MVEMKKRGELGDLLDNQPKDYLKELCYLLDLKRGGTKAVLIDRIVYSEFDYKYVHGKARFLSLGLILLNYLNAQQVRDILRERDISTMPRKWDNMVEIIKSEQVEPSELLGMLPSADLESLYWKLFEEPPPPIRDKVTSSIISAFEVDWLEEETSSGFIMMAMGKDPDLGSALRMIKNECQRHGIKAIRIDDIQDSDLITKEVIEQINEADYLFVDLTHERPNVYYELGYGHGIRKDPKDIVLLARKGTTLHFDIRNMRTIIWKDPEDLRRQLRSRLSSMLQE